MLWIRSRGTRKTRKTFSNLSKNGDRQRRDTTGLRRESIRGRCGGRGLRVFAARVPAASDLVGIYEDVGAVLMTLSTSSVPSFQFSTSVSGGSAIRAIRTSTGA